VSRNKTTRQQDYVDVAIRLLSWQKGLFPTAVSLGRTKGFEISIEFLPVSYPEAIHAVWIASGISAR
jgi:hypothetical protein